MRTIACLACGSRNDYEAASCAACGEHLAPAKIEEASAAIRVSTTRLEHRQALRTGQAFSTINGFGTMLVDYRPRGDGTYHAVRWVTAAGVPLVPLGEYVIRPHYREVSHGSHSTSFSIVQRRPLTARRVLRTYLLLAIGLLPLVLGWINSDRVNDFFGEGPAFFVMLATGVWAFYIVFYRISNSGGIYKPLPPPNANW